jgi:hypothetical protein
MSLPPPQVHMDASTYYASVYGGQCLFAASSGALNPSNAGVVIAGLSNPGGSGKSLYIYSVYYSASGSAATFVRSRNGTITGGTAYTILNQGGGSLASVATFVTGATTITNTSPLASTMTYQAGTDSGGVHHYGGTIILLPGQSLAWTAIGSPSNTCALNVVWWEL